MRISKSEKIILVACIFIALVSVAMLVFAPMFKKDETLYHKNNGSTTSGEEAGVTSGHTPESNQPDLDMKILCLGDSIFGNDGEIVKYLAELNGSNVVNGAIGGTRVTIRPSATDQFQYLDGQNLVQALTSGDWANVDSAVEALKGTYTWLPDRVATLKALDMSTVDLLIMDWGTNDYAGGRTIEEILTAYGVVIDSLQSAFPELRILITTPIWRHWGTAEDNENGDNKVFADATLKEIAKAIENFAKDKRISVINAYENMPLSYNTAATYFDEGSGVHLNSKGNMVYAHLLNGKIRSMYAAVTNSP